MQRTQKITNNKLLYLESLSEIFMPGVHLTSFISTLKSCSKNKVKKIESIKTCIKKTSERLR